MTTDPFDQLLDPRAPGPGVPDREFVHRLRGRVQQALGRTVAEQRAGNIFYFTIPAPDADRSRRFWSTVLGWDLEPSPSGFNISGIAQPGGLNVAEPQHGPTVWVRVPDIHEASRAVESLGGSAERPIEYPTGWSVGCRTPSGTRFHLSTPAAAYDHEPEYGRRHGDLFYLSLPAPDPDVAVRFFSRVVGWQFDEPGSAGGLHVANAVTECGLGGGREGEFPELFFRVDDIEEARRRVAANGGAILSDVMEGPEGRHLMCDDGQGVVFGLSEPTPGY